MKPTARVWIYQSNRVFTEIEVDSLNEKLLHFTQNWSAHAQALDAGYVIKNNRFLILVVDEETTSASGCSIDKSVNLMKEIEREYNINLFDRFQIAWKEGDQILTADRNTFENKIQNGHITENTIVFNNLVNTYQDFLTKWEIPFKDSWHSKIFPLPIL